MKTVRGQVIARISDGRKVNVYADFFQSQRDLYNYLITHNPIFDMDRNRISDTYRSHDAEWQGYETGVQLRSDFLACRCDYNAIRHIASSIEPNRDTHKRIKYMSVAQGVPVVPVVLTGMPLNMLSSKRVKIPAKIIDLYINVSARACVDASDLEKAGKEIMAEVLALEQNGYRVNLYACECSKTGGMIAMLIMKVKDAGQPMNVARCQYPIINPQFLRGISFAWYQRAPIGHEWGYGRPVDAVTFAECLKSVGVSRNAIQVALKDILEGRNAHQYIADRLNRKEL